MSDQVAIPGEYCSLLLEEVSVAATKTFTFNLDVASYGTFVARGTSKWRTNKVADIGATLDGDGLVVCVDTSPEALQFDDLFTYAASRTQLTAVFTLRSGTPGEVTFIYTGEAYITTLSASSPIFGEATYSFSLLFTGEVVQTTGTVPSPP